MTNWPGIRLLEWCRGYREMALGKCKNCKFWDKFQGEHAGLCKRYPPAVFTDGKQDKFWQQPETNNNDQCGEFEQEEI